jgi:hypothetical protein
MNPMFDLAPRLEAAILRLEGELGLTPAGRMRLGLHLSGERAPTLGDLRQVVVAEETAGKDGRSVLVELDQRRRSDETA